MVRTIASVTFKWNIYVALIFLIGASIIFTETYLYPIGMNSVVGYVSGVVAGMYMVFLGLDANVLIVEEGHKGEMVNGEEEVILKKLQKECFVDVCKNTHYVQCPACSGDLCFEHAGTDYLCPEHVLLDLNEILEISGNTITEYCKIGDENDSIREQMIEDGMDVPGLW